MTTQETCSLCCYNTRTMVLEGGYPSPQTMFGCSAVIRGGTPPHLLLQQQFRGGVPPLSQFCENLPRSGTCSEPKQQGSHRNGFVCVLQPSQWLRAQKARFASEPRIANLNYSQTLFSRYLGTIGQASLFTRKETAGAILVNSRM